MTHVYSLTVPKVRVQNQSPWPGGQQGWLLLQICLRSLVPGSLLHVQRCHQSASLTASVLTLPFLFLTLMPPVIRPS